MFLPDVNVLIYAHRTDSCADHAAYAEWLTGLIEQTEQELPPPKPRKKKKR